MSKKGLFIFVVALLCWVSYSAYKKQEQIGLWWELKDSSPEWAKEQLDRDFAPFVKPGISQEALDQTFAKIQSHHIPAYRYRILDGKIYRTPGDEGPLGRAHTFDKILKRLLKSSSLPNLDFLVCMMDGVPESYVAPDFWITEKQAPLLTWAMKKEASHLILIPDFLITRESGWHRETSAVIETSQRIPWEHKKDLAFWRGGSSDKNYSLVNYFEKPRFLMSLLSKKHPELIDAGFTVVYPEEVKELFQEMDLIAEHTPVVDHLHYKYLPVLDGYMCTFPGFQWRLLSGSLTLKQESDEIQYFYGALKPYVHYLPIKHNLSDLVGKISWAKEHDEEARQIAENARVFALSNLMPNQVYHYLYSVLQMYAKYQTFDDLEMNSTWKCVSRY
jgi:hypothetical protein